MKFQYKLRKIHRCAHYNINIEIRKKLVGIVAYAYSSAFSKMRVETLYTTPTNHDKHLSFTTHAKVTCSSPLPANLVTFLKAAVMLFVCIKSCFSFHLWEGKKSVGWMWLNYVQFWEGLAYPGHPGCVYISYLAYSLLSASQSIRALQGSVIIESVGLYCEALLGVRECTASYYR